MRLPTLGQIQIEITAEMLVVPFIALSRVAYVHLALAGVASVVTANAPQFSALIVRIATTPSADRHHPPDHRLRSFRQKGETLVPLGTGGVNLGESADALLALYVAEREAGGVVQTSILVIWIAATTYLTAAFGVIGLLHDKLDAPYLYYLLPAPACALAGYHLILFGIGVVRSNSIEKLEKGVLRKIHSTDVGMASRDTFGSAAETNWTTWGKDNLSMTASGVIAFLVPYLSALALTIVCLSNVSTQCSNVSDSCGPAFYAASLIYLTVGISIASLAMKTVRKLGAEN
ncbi:hypothetical protein [Mycobacterium sp. C31M]